jgi:hypothetical protein
MANDVFANGREVSCKKADGKSTCSFPDVCMTPPENPATPPGVPIPYPNTAFASDTTDGSRSVQISGKEIMLKNKSYFKKSTGDEAGCAAKKGVVTSVNRGKVYFIAWSMDVKAEGENVVRHLDMTTHNHASPMANESIPWPYVDAAALADPLHPCNKYASEVADKCPPPEKSLGARQPKEFIGGKLIDRGDFPGETIPPGPQDNTSPDCCTARKCMLVPEQPKARCKQCGSTAHHPIPVGEFSLSRGAPESKGKDRGASAVKDYNSKKAPCICVDGDDHDETEDDPPYDLKEHGLVGQEFTKNRDAILNGRTEYKYHEARDAAAKAVTKITSCDEECIKKQLDAGHEAMGVDSDDTVRKSQQKAKRDPRKTPKPKSRRI